MTKLVEHTLVKDGQEKVVRLRDYEDPNKSAYGKRGWKLKTNKSKEFHEVVKTNNAIIDAKLNEKKESVETEEETTNQDQPPKSVDDMSEEELKKILSDNKIKFGRAKKATLIAKVKELISDD